MKKILFTAAVFFLMIGCSDETTLVDPSFPQSAPPPIVLTIGGKTDTLTDGQVAVSIEDYVPAHPLIISDLDSSLFTDTIIHGTNQDLTVLSKVYHIILSFPDSQISRYGPQEISVKRIVPINDVLYAVATDSINGFPGGLRDTLNTGGKASTMQHPWVSWVIGDTADLWLTKNLN